MSFQTRIDSEIEELVANQDIFVEKKDQRKLAELVEIHCKWNSVHNISAHRTTRQVIEKQIGDSLTLIPFLDKIKKYFVFSNVYQRVKKRKK